MSEPADSEGAAPPEVPSGPIADLRDRGDVEGLMTLAGQYRTGEGPHGKDLGKCLECYLAAADLGSAAGAYAAALFHISGIAVDHDVPAGVALLRRAASAGHVDAKVYLGNIYYLGIHYEPDHEKADVWYRSAAREADVPHEPGTRDYSLAMAALGNARECDEIIGDAELPKEERVACLRKAKALGLSVHKKLKRAAEADEEAAAAEEEPEEESLDRDEAEEAVKRLLAARAAEDAKKGKKPPPGKDEEKKTDEASPWSVGAGLLSFLGAVAFLACAAVAGFFAAAGAGAALPDMAPLPWLGHPEEFVLPVAVILIGMVPCFFLYRADPVLVGMLAAVAAGAAGYFLYGYVFIWVFGRLNHSAAFAAAAFLLVLFFWGLRGGTRRRR